MRTYFVLVVILAIIVAIEGRISRFKPERHLKLENANDDLQGRFFIASKLAALKGFVAGSLLKPSASTGSGTDPICVITRKQRSLDDFEVNHEIAEVQLRQIGTPPPTLTTTGTTAPTTMTTTAPPPPPPTINCIIITRRKGTDKASLFRSALSRRKRSINQQ